MIEEVRGEVGHALATARGAEAAALAARGDEMIVAAALAAKAAEALLQDAAVEVAQQGTAHEGGHVAAVVALGAAGLEGGEVLADDGVQRGSRGLTARVARGGRARRR